MYNIITIIIIIINGSTSLFVGPWPLFQSVDSLEGGSARRKASTYTQDNTNWINTDTFIPRVEFEPTTPTFQRPKYMP
jgi:hypothetical protein